MEHSQGWPAAAASTERTELLGAVHGVRTRWKVRRALLGAAIALAAGLVVLAILAYVLKALDYGDTVVMVGQTLAGVTVLALLWWLVIRPILPNPSDTQMALFIEERAPSLDASLLTAVELDARERSTGALGRSPALAMRLFQSARDRIRKIDDAREVDRRALNQSVMAFAAMATLTAIVTLAGPRALKHGMKLLLTPWDRAQPAALYAILVEPGDATVARGGDQIVAARLYGFQSDAVDLLVKRADSTGWTRVAMSRDTAGARYTFRLLDIAGGMDYVVESNGIRSRAYHLTVADLPYVRTMRHEYRFPAYTQLGTKVVEDGSDIVALNGTVVKMKITPTRPAVGGRLVLDHGDTVALKPQADGTLEGLLKVSRPGFYKVELRTADGRTVPASLEYSVDVLPDRPPTVSFNKPGHDAKVLAVDEVYTEIKAEDDYGVQRADLVFSVNGGPEQTVRVHDNTGKNLTELAAGHTLMLEDYKLEPGDVISYYARVADNNTVSGPQTATSDIYFLQVRPYEQDYRQQQGGGQGGGGQQDNPGSLSQRERDIIAATFKTTRDKAITQPKELEENIATIRLGQQRLREDVDDLTRRLHDRGIAARDTDFKKIADILTLASATMDTAEKALGTNDPQPALPPEQRALKHLQRAEAVYKDVQIRMGGGGGGGGGGQQQRAEDLADLFELNKDKLRNQYESVQRGQQQQQQQQQAQMDETLERLKQLAARQQQENERAMRKMDSLNLGQSGSGGGGAQRQMAQQAEEAARQLERLARERNSPELQEAARRLQESADAMRRAAQGGQQGAAEGRQAQQRLEDARRLLENARSGSFGSEMQKAVETARRLRQQEEQVAQDVNKLGGSNGADREQRAQQLSETKGQMADAVKGLRNQLDRMSLDGRKDQKEAAQQLGDAAQALRDSRLEDRLRMSQSQVGTAPPEYAKQAEVPIQASIEDLQQRLEGAQRTAQQGAGGQNGNRQAQAADRARDLANSMEGMAERMQQRQEANRRLGNGAGADSAGTQGQQNGQRLAQRGQGQAGNQNGQQSPQSSGQRGAQGQQGQGQQGQNQQGQGQQGQRGQGQGQAQQNQGQGQGQGQQGQSGQSQGNQGNQPGGQGGQAQGRNGNSQNGGMPQGAGGGRLSPDDARQFAREMRERLNDAEGLRRDLQREGMNTGQLDRAIQGMRSLADDKLVGDDKALAMLKSQVVEGLKGFEFDLRRALGMDKDRVLLGRTGDVPEGYRQYVEDYYRSLAGGKPKKP